MRDAIFVHKNRTNVKRLVLGFDVSGESFTSQIRSKDDLTGDVLATWSVTFETDGSDGVLILTLLAAQLTNIQVTNGWMDVKRMSGGQPLALFDDALQVVFKDTVTE